ncbi:MAG: YbhB/YbcL family Raf kinase inhibitor-like protein [Candidatus Hydrogenedentes bacterium]|nr:YbhB/YbcL family Raf kinase inhibitor-like protein [Candidatus Hydrogenedentota bacterium]
MNAKFCGLNVGSMRFGAIVLSLAVAFGCQKAEGPSQTAGRGTQASAERPDEPGLAASSDETAAGAPRPAGGEHEQEGGNAMTLDITSPAFEDQGSIPKQYTADGEDVSPPLSWTGVPEETQSLALICDDPDAPVGTWVHWVIWNIPVSETGLKEGIPAKERELPNGAVQGTNDFRKIGYGGPAPPRGPAHRYFFKLYALDTSLDLAPGAKKDALEKAMEGHVLAEAQLVGQYAR